MADVDLVDDWELFTKSNEVVRAHLARFGDTGDDIFLDACRARMMFHEGNARWEPYVRMMLDGTIECGAMVRHYRHALILTHVPAPSPATPTRRGRRAKRRKKSINDTSRTHRI